MSDSFSVGWLLTALDGPASWRLVVAIVNNVNLIALEPV